jgi:hypothetical protein
MPNLPYINTVRYYQPVFYQKLQLLYQMMPFY